MCTLQQVQFACYNVHNAISIEPVYVFEEKLFILYIDAASKSNKGLLRRAVSIPVSWHSGGVLATMLVATINDIVFSFLF